MSYENKHVLGQDGTYTFFGVVVDINDPKKIGRVKVRCHGIHDKSNVTLPIDTLPWSQVINSTNELTTSYIKLGATVYGVFLDGRELQVPMVLGVLPGLASESGKPSLSAYAVQGDRLAAQKKSAPFGYEPSDPYDAKYPYNNVHETESGHVIELDDTAGAERVHVFHRSGSYIEIHPNGDVVKKSVANDYTISINDNNISAGGNVNIVVTGSVNITAPANVNIDGNVIVSGDVIASGISLVHHRHDRTMPGLGTTGTPI